MHKTKNFRMIKSRAVIGKVIYIVTKDNSASSVLESIKENEMKLSESENELFEKYGLKDLSCNKNDIPFYSKLLYFYDCVISLWNSKLTKEIEKKYMYWTGEIFRYLHGKGPENTTFEHAKVGLEKLNKYLAIRSWMVTYQLSALDIILASSLRHNVQVWASLKEIKFKGFENIKRWFDWIESLNEIFWDVIYFKDENKTSVKKAKDTQKALTGSRELIEAVTRGDITKARAILKANPLSVASWDMKKNKTSLAHIACEQKNLEMLKLLVEFKIDLESTDCDGMTCLYSAIEQGDTHMTQYLIGQGINLNHRDQQERSCIYWAASSGEIPNLKLLIEAGWDPNLQSKLGRTALSKACWNGFVDVTKVLLESGKIDIDLKDNHGRTALHNAIWGSAGGRLGEKLGISNEDSPEWAQLLLDSGANPNIEDNSGNTPINIACSTFGINWIRLLVAYGADINRKNNYGTSPFLSAWYRGNFEWWKVLYEFPNLDPYVKTRHGYGPLELAIEAGKDRVLKWVLEEKVTNNKEYPGLEIGSYDIIQIMHHSVNNPKNNCTTLLSLLDYVKNTWYDKLLEWFVDILNRALLRKSKEAVQTLLNFYQEQNLSHKIKFNEVLLESSIYLNDFDIFQQFLDNYDDVLPQICLQSVIFKQNDLFLDLILNKFRNEFTTADCYRDLDTLPSDFTKIIDKDVLVDYKYFDKISHPIFNDDEKMKEYWNYNPLQMAVYLDNSRIVKLLLDGTCYKATTPLKNGDNIIHIMMKDKYGDSFILQKLLERLEQELGSAEAVLKEVLLAKSTSDGLDVMEYCTGSKVYAPIIYKYGSISGLPEDDLYAQSSVLDVDILHETTVEEEAKLDKKITSEEIKAYATEHYKELIKNTEILAKKPQFVLDYSKQLGLDLSGKIFND